VEIKVEMDQDTIERQLMEAIRVCMETGGRECPQLTGDTVPLKDLQGFDSLCAIEVLVDLESRLGKELGEDLFAVGSRKTAKQRSLRDVAEAILKGEKSAKKGIREKHA
jgi:acyl carrier protein